MRKGDRASIGRILLLKGTGAVAGHSFLLRIEGTKIIKDMEEESKTKFSMNVKFSFAFKIHKILRS